MAEMCESFQSTINYRIKDTHIHHCGYFDVVIEIIDYNNSKIYFQKDNINIDVPEGMRFVNMTHNIENSIHTIDSTRCFLVSWIDNYELLFQGVLIFSLISQ